MINENKISNAQNILDSMDDNVRVKMIKKDRGLLERTETEKVIIMEDNREVLLG